MIEHNAGESASQGLRVIQWRPRRRPESREPLRPVAARQKPQATAGCRRELQDRSCPPEPAVPRPCSRSLSISVFRAFLGENTRPAREVGDPAGVGPVLAGSAGRGRRRADVVKLLCRSRMEPGAVAVLLEDVADRALRSEFKPDDGAGAGVVAEAVGDQSIQRPVITGSGDVMKVTMHFHN